VKKEQEWGKRERRRSSSSPLSILRTSKTTRQEQRECQMRQEGVTALSLLLLRLYVVKEKETE